MAVTFKYNLIGIMILFSLAVKAQEKIEVEKRVNADEVPQKAVDWLKDAYEKDLKIKWYYEETSGLKSYEAKLRWNNHLHSIEFDTAGVIQDIEIAIKWRELPDEVQQNIVKYMNSTFDKFTVQKIQKQWTGKADDLEDIIDEDEMEDIITNYELEYYGKTESNEELLEGLFNSRGELLNQRIVKLRPTDNLNF